jgi:hypothetical protein
MLMKLQVPTKQLKNFGMMKFEARDQCCNLFTLKKENEDN